MTSIAELHAQGNTALSKNDVTAAADHYRHALQLLSTSPSSLPSPSTRASLHLNLALALLRAHDFDGVVAHCSWVLAEEDPRSAKALYRRACAYKALGEVVRAERDLVRAVEELGVKDPAVERVLAEVRKMITDARRSVKAAFARNFHHTLKNELYHSL